MSTRQNQGGPGKKRKPRRNDSQPAAPRREERELLPTSVYRNGHGDGEQIVFDTKLEKSSPGRQAPPPANGLAEPGSEDREPSDYLIAMKEVMRRTSICRGTIEYLMTHSDFPSPVKCGRRMVRWWSSEVERWMRSRPRAQGDLGKRHNPDETGG